MVQVDDPASLRDAEVVQELSHWHFGYLSHLWWSASAPVAANRVSRLACCCGTLAVDGTTEPFISKATAPHDSMARYRGLADPRTRITRRWEGTAGGSRSDVANSKHCAKCVALVLYSVRQSDDSGWQQRLVDVGSS